MRSLLLEQNSHGWWVLVVLLAYTLNVVCLTCCLERYALCRALFEVEMIHLFIVVWFTGVEDILKGSRVLIHLQRARVVTHVVHECIGFLLSLCVTRIRVYLFDEIFMHCIIFCC